MLRAIRHAGHAISITPGARGSARSHRPDLGARVKALIDAGGPDIVYQPIIDLPHCNTVAFEAFSRFPATDPPVSPDHWFTQAGRMGLGPALETVAIQTALQSLDWLGPHQRVAVNASARTLLEPAFIRTLDQHDTSRIAVEITEHERVVDYPRLRRACGQLRERDVAIAVDDAGVGHAGFTHLVELQPDIIKLDRQLTHGIDTDPARAAMAAALVAFARAIGAQILAEGVETGAELSTATQLGIQLAQGYHIARPRPAPTWDRTSPGRRERATRPAIHVVLP